MTMVSNRKSANNIAAYKKFYKQYNIAKLLEAIEETSRLITKVMREKKEIDAEDDAKELKD